MQSCCIGMVEFYCQRIYNYNTINEEKYLVYLIYFIHSAESQAKPNNAYALNLRNASMKQPEADLFKKPSFRCRMEFGRTREKPTEASLDWKPDVRKYRDRESNPGLIGAKQKKIRYANLLPKKGA